LLACSYPNWGLAVLCSRVPQRGHHRPPVGPDIMAALRGPGTAAPKRRPGTAGAIDEAPTAIDKGVRRHGPRGMARVAISLSEEEVPSEITKLHCNVQPSEQGRQGHRLRPGGMGFVKVPGRAQVSVKEKFFPRGEAPYKAKSSDWGLARPTF
jgi:hypothetical protein